MSKKRIDEIGEVEVTDMLSATKKNVEIEMFQKKYIIEICFQIEDIEDEKRSFLDERIMKIYKEFFHNLSENIKEAEKEILNYYNTEVKERYLEGYYDEYEEIKESKELGEKEILELKAIFFQTYIPETGVLHALIFDCDWDDDGFAVMYQNGKIEELGSTDIIL